MKTRLSQEILYVKDLYEVNGFLKIKYDKFLDKNIILCEYLTLKTFLTNIQIISGVKWHFLSI